MRIDIIGAIATLCFMAAVCVYCVHAMSLEHTKEQKLYTVKTADAVYLDLSKERNNGNWASYKTTTGKRIIFNGTFTEIEQ